MFAGLVFALVIGNMLLSEFAAALSGDAVIDPPALFIYAEADFDRMVQMTLDDPGALVVDVPGVGEVLARRDHIVSKHGQAVFDAILKARMINGIVKARRTYTTRRANLTTTTWL